MVFFRFYDSIIVSEVLFQLFHSSLYLLFIIWHKKKTCYDFYFIIADLLYLYIYLGIFIN